MRILDMRWQALATDFDGTLAVGGSLDDPTRDALRSFRAAGAAVVLVTGRELQEFLDLGIPLEIFDLIVAENGAVLYDPATAKTSLLAPAPPPEFAEALRERNVSPLSIGECIVATVEPHESIVLETIRRMGLELQVIFNKGAVMVLPTGVNKATGLRRALEILKLDPLRVVGVGDAENDHAFLRECGLAVAVANALPSLKEEADWITSHAAGAGVTELVDRLLDGNFETAGDP